MTIYKHKSEDKVQAKNSDKEASAVLADDDEVCTLRVRIHDKLQVLAHLFHLWLGLAHSPGNVNNESGERKRRDKALRGFNMFNTQALGIGDVYPYLKTQPPYPSHSDVNMFMWKWNSFYFKFIFNYHMLS